MSARDLELRLTRAAVNQRIGRPERQREEAFFKRLPFAAFLVNRRSGWPPFWLAAVLFLLVTRAQAAPWSGILDPSRAIDWGQAGVSGGIPNRAAVCTTLNPGATSDQINAAIANCAAGQVVYLTAGTYNLTTSIQPKSNVTLRGAGIGVTILKGASGFSGDGLISYGDITNWYLTDQPSYDLINPQKGNTTITTTSNHSWKVGDYLQIDQLEDPTGSTVISSTGGEGSNLSGACRNPAAPCRPTGQTVKIVSIPAPNQAVIDTPLYWTYKPSPQATRISSYHTGMGFEDFTLDNTLSQSGKIMHLGGAFESWVLRVEMIAATTYGLFSYGAYHDTVRSCVFHEGYAGTGGGYTVMLWNRASANLFEDNIIFNLGIMVLMDGSITGNVFAYNYGTKPVYGNNTAGTEFGMHGAHPMMNLFEGNQFEGRFRMDYTWGTNSHATMFRNRLINDQNPIYDSVRNLIDLWAYSRYNNIVGNVLGMVGQESVYQETAGAPNQYAEVVYAFGESSLYGARGTDPAVLGTVYRQGNWDSVHNAVRWDEDTVNPDHTLPASFYQTAKPAWFGACTWPPIGSDLNPMSNDIPAKRRFDGNPCATSGTSSCDINRDNATNVVDVQQEINQALGAAACTSDINKDGACNVIDVQRVVNAALGGACVSP